MGLVLPGVGAWAGWVAALCAQLVVLVARWSAALPSAEVGWSSSLVGVLVLAVLCLGLVLLGPRLLRRRGPVLAAVVLLGLGVVLRPVWDPLWQQARHPGWPPEGWVLVMCDVGQGDALVLPTGPHEAVVVDTGPDPGLVDGCLDRLGVRRVPAVVLTHFHADHVDGLPGVLAGPGGRRGGGDQPARPPYGAAAVDRWAAAARGAGAGPRVRGAGASRGGELAGRGPQTPVVRQPERRLRRGARRDRGPADPAHRGRRATVAGSPAEALPAAGVGPVDVLKVPHHGSRYQDARLLTGLGARLALVSVGADNDYGHPDPGTLDLLREAGAAVRRTDLDGDVAVVVREGRLEVVTRG